MSLSVLFIIVAVVLFILVALGVGASYPLTALGLASFAAGHLPLSSRIG